MEQVTREHLLNMMRKLIDKTEKSDNEYKREGFRPEWRYIELDARSYEIYLSELLPSNRHRIKLGLPPHMRGVDILMNADASHPSMGIFEKSEGTIEDIVKGIRFFPLEKINAALAAGGHPEIKIVSIGDPPKP